MSQVIDINGFTSDHIAGPTPVSLSEYKGEGALFLAIDEDPSDAAAHFDTLELIVIPFASSADGRGFSCAAELRALGYLGLLRASGHLLVDQFRAALRCGFDQVEISDDQAARNPEAQWLSVSHAAGYHSQIYA